MRSCDSPIHPAAVAAVSSRCFMAPRDLNRNGGNKVERGRSRSPTLEVHKASRPSARRL